MKDLRFVLLLDCYGSLLTEKQYALLDGYYNEDLSLAELAEPLSVSRQAVHDSIRRGERQLEAYESQMGIAKRLSEYRRLFSQIEALSQQISEPADLALAAEIAENARQGINLK